MRNLGIIWFALILASPVEASQHLGYWREDTPKGESFGCQGVQSHDGLVDILEKAGWPVNDGIPSIDWATEEAVVVSPSKVYPDANLVFFGLESSEGGFSLQYGHQTEPDTNTATCDPGGICSSTLGSKAPITAQTIVVSYPRGMDTGLSFKCADLGVDP